MIRRSLFCLGIILVVILPSGGRADDEADADAKLLAENRAGPDEKALREFFRKRSPTPDDLGKIEVLVRQLGDRSFTRRMRASDALTAWGPAALDALRRGLTDSDLEIVRRCERCLEEIERPGNSLSLAGVRQVARLKFAGGIALLLDYIPNADDDQVTETVLAALRSLADPKKPDEALLRALADRAPARRAAAAHVLGRHAATTAREAVAKLLADPEVLVRFRAAESLLLARERVSVPALIDLLRSAKPELRWQVEDLLARLPGCIKDEPVTPVSPSDDKPEDLRQWRDAWAGWWAKYGSSADLAKVEERVAFQNVTLVPEMHAHKVWEYGPDGKTRWELKGDLRTPIDAQVLVNGRILVAELDGGRVTERDRAGKIIWQHPVATPIYVRRMTGGNTFISTNHACFIVTPAGKEVFRYTPEGNFFIHSIHQMSNNHIVAISMDGDVREIAPDGKVIRTIPLAERGSWSGIEGLPGNRYLCVGSSRVREIDATGKVLWKLDHGGACFATRLPSGNTLVVDNSKGLFEYNRDGKVVAQRPIGTALWRVHRR
jgi:HEAT repeat protein